MNQEKKQKKKTLTKAEAAELAEIDAKAQADLEATDDLLDEIDVILEETAIQVAYIQKGGE